MNVLAYILYLLLSYLITVRVGLRFYRNGRLYILALFQGNESIADSINRLLLVGYYLLNLGYAALMISTWETIDTWEALIVTVCSMTGKIMLTLAVIHFINMLVIYLVSKRKQLFINHKN